MKRLFFLSALLCVLLACNQSYSFNTNKNTVSTIANSLCPAPIISSFFPLSGPENTLITVSGSNFNAVTSIEFDGINASFNIINDTEIEVVVPAGIAATSTISMTSSGGCTGVSPTVFTQIDSDCNLGNNEVYISEVYDSDGGSYGVIELYNPTSAVIVLDGVYQIDRYGDIGNATPSYSIPLTGTINPFDTFIIEMGSTGNACSGLVADLNLGAGINENDEIILLKNSVPIDVMHTDVNIGYTFIRNSDAVAPSTTFDINEWTFSDTEDCSGLGNHSEDPISVNITQPTSQEVCENGNTTFSVSVDTGTYSYQWKILDASGNWIDVVNNANYSGATTNTLGINNIPLNFDDNQYYCEITSSSCDLTSIAVQLQITSPEVDTIANQNVCTDYTLPTLTNGSYFTGTNGTGTLLNAGDVISTTQTIFIYNEVGTAPDICSNESSFTVTISATPLVDTIANQNVCTDYTLPTLTNGSYFTGTNGSGTPLNAGDVISTTQTIFIYNEVGTAPDICSNESSFTVTISATPLVDTIANQNVCTDYTLPTLTNGSYFTGTNGTGTPLNAGDVISTTQTIFIYNEVGTAPDICSNESSFTVTVSATPLVDTIANQNVCTDYTLPTLTNGSYFTGTNGTGTPLNAGDVISTTQTIFIYNEVGTAPDICSNESSFTVTVSATPLVDTIANQNVCTDYTLPTLTNGSYFTGTNGTGTLLNAGDVISTTQTIFIYNEVGTAPDICSNESSFTVTVSATPLVDTIANQNVCSDYTLPTLTNGSYFTGTNGTGTPLNAGDVISTTQTIFIYNEVGTAPDICSNESSFTVTVSATPLVDTIANQNVCTDYTLPTLTNGSYFTGTNGTGTPLNAGDVISTTQTIFIYNEVGTAPDICSNESSFTVTISATPLVDTIANQNVCTDYTLPTLTNGSYFTGTNGTGTPLNAGDVISTTQTIFIYNEVGTAPDICSNESSFTVIIGSSTDFNLTEANIEILNGTLTVTMNDQTLNYEYSIDSVNFQTSHIFSDLPLGSYILYVREVGGCITKYLFFEIALDLFIPKFLTPNNDGYKDTWKIIDTKNVIRDIFIFDRYGKLLKHIVGNTVSWNGTYNGKALETNDYWYIINLRTGEQLKGHFTLKR
ncbi:T9SS type B sorting domain-containing protein [Psychroserpens mesophilus]|uniref:T9SS type B sorting domain-containing protein n=1 Tax=Psychroserpens mesophilus TaxID=325473 RepID=UPI003D6516CA